MPSHSGVAAKSPTGIVTFLFTDIEGSTRLWDQAPERMQPALAKHDALARRAVASHRGTVVKTTGDGLYAAFDDSLDALAATLEFQHALLDPDATHGVALRVRCGLHAGEVEFRDNDYFGTAVNRTARIMGTAHGGQVILSQAVADAVAGRLPADVALRDLGSVRLRDLARPERVYQLMHPLLRRDFPALRSLESTPNNLPQQVSSFVGRERQLEEAKTLLGESRLLTLLGTGGLGKSRLSLQVAVELIDDFPDGVWLVELAPLSDGRMVAQAVASVLGVKEEAGRPVQEALAAFVRDRRLLLILDNCEHLLSACAELVTALLQAGAHLRVLASSREPLREAGEATYQVPPLATPDPDRITALDDLSQFDSIRLFKERAVATQPGFRVTPENAAAVAGICRRLDGIPLAIELAAARVRNLPVEKIAERLSDRFRVLTGGSRSALPRQQTLRACIDWSYNLLTPPERTVLQRLAVFAGGFTLEAAEEVAAGGDIREPDVLDLLTQLVDRSLVGLDADGARYLLLETVREYALELLAEAHEGDGARARHFRYYLALAEQADRKLQGPEQGKWLDRLDAERENLLLAHAWCDAAEARAGPGLRLAYGAQTYWMRRGLLRLGYRVTVEALERPGALGRTLERCRALYAAGNLGWGMARYGEAQAYVEEGLAIAREIGDDDRIAATLVLLGTILGELGDRAGARVCYEESLVLCERLGNTLRLANVLGSLAVLHGSEGELDIAESLFERSLAISRQQGNPNNVAANLCNLAIVSSRRGMVDHARASLFEALTIVERSGSRALGLAILGIAPVVAATAGEWERAACFHGASQSERSRQGVEANRDDAILAPLLARAQGVLGAQAFAAAEDAGRRLAYERAVAEVRAWLATAA